MRCFLDVSKKQPIRSVIYVEAARIVEKKVSCHKLDHVRTSQQKDKGRVVSKQGWGAGEGQEWTRFV